MHSFICDMCLERTNRFIAIRSLNFLIENILTEIANSSGQIASANAPFGVIKNARHDVQEKTQKNAFLMKTKISLDQEIVPF